MVGKPERKRPLGRPRHRWEDNIKMVLEYTVCEVVDWVHVALDRHKWRAILNTVMKIRVP
jgi:hypothetical protein